MADQPVKTPSANAEPATENAKSQAVETPSAASNTSESSSKTEGNEAKPNTEELEGNEDKVEEGESLETQNDKENDINQIQHEISDGEIENNSDQFDETEEEKTEEELEDLKTEPDRETSLDFETKESEKTEVNEKNTEKTKDLPDQTPISEQDIIKNPIDLGKIKEAYELSQSLGKKTENSQEIDEVEPESDLERARKEMEKTKQGAAEFKSLEDFAKNIEEEKKQKAKTEEEIAQRQEFVEKFVTDIISKIKNDPEKMGVIRELATTLKNLFQQEKENGTGLNFQTSFKSQGTQNADQLEACTQRFCSETGIKREDLGIDLFTKLLDGIILFQNKQKDISVYPAGLPNSQEITVESLHSFEPEIGNWQEQSLGLEIIQQNSIQR